MNRKLRSGASHIICLIYLLCNHANDKVYVGQTWRPLHARWDDGRGYKGCTHLYRAIELYGAEAFYYRVLTVAHTQEAANYWEDYFTSQYEARNIDKGYNVKEAGSRGKHSEETKQRLSETMKGRPPSEATKQAMRLALTGKPRSEETKRKISEGNKGKLGPWKGISPLETTRKKISASLTGKPKTEEHNHKVSEAAKARGIARIEKVGEQTICSMYLDGASLTKITSEVALAPATVTAVLKKNGIDYDVIRVQANETREAREQQIIALYVAGDTYPQILEKTGCGENTITRTIRRNNLPLRSTIPVVNPKETLICEMYVAGATYADIARASGYSSSGVRKVVQRNGLQPRSTRKPKQ